MKNNHEKEIKMNDSIINENEKFFTELATAYVKKDGEDIRVKDTLQASKLSTDYLDKKMKWRMKRRDEKSRRTRRNRMAMLSALAACFFMFIVYYAVSPMFLRQDFPAPAGMDVMEVQFFAPEPEPEAEMDVVEAPAQEMVDDMAELVVEAEDESLGVVEEEIVFGIEDRDELSFDELLSFVCVLGVRDSREYFEGALPDGYRITGVEYYEYSTGIILMSATNHSIELRESHRELPGELIMRMELYGETEYHTIDIDGIEVAQLVLEDMDSRDYLLHLQATDRYFTVIGSELNELITVARALIHLPELDFDEVGHDGAILDTGADIVEEIMNNMRLPRGLVTLVPIP